MPTWTQGNASSPTDDEMRSAAKWCQLLYDTVGPRPSPFPEGVAPFPGDDYQRLLEKIGILSGGASSGSVCVPPTAPSNVEALAAGAFVIDFTWDDNSSDETGFDIRWRNVTTASAFTDEPSVAADVESGQLTVTGSTDGDTIEVQVRAHGAGCNSDWASDTVIVTDTN